MKSTLVRLKSVVTNPVVKSDGKVRPFIGLEHIAGGAGRLVTESIPKRAAEDSLLHEAGDVLFGRLRPYLAKSFLAKFPATASSELLVLRPTSQLDSRFLLYITLSKPFLAFAEQTSYGAKMPRTSWKDLSTYQLRLPPLEEQRRLADFLDAKISRMDALAARRLRWIELLIERWRTQADQAIRSNTEMEAPLRRFLARKPEYGAGEPGGPGPDTWPRYIRITDITDSGELKENDPARLPPSIASRYSLADGDILLARSGATVGKGFLYKSSMGPACFAGYLIRIRVREDISPEYVKIWLETRHYWDQINMTNTQATIQNISADRYGSLSFPFMPPSRQRAIVDEFSRRAEQIRHLRKLAIRQVKVLAERKQAVITAAVTGSLT